MSDRQWLTDLQLQAQTESLSYLLFWGHQHRVGQPISKSCLSQWYDAPFVINGVRYATAEHWMMVAKARLFDPIWQAQILAHPDPAIAKAFGRKIDHFDEKVWQQQRFALVVEGNLAKFSQHPPLQDFLLATAGHVLVEAAPNDRIWGIGLAVDDSRARQPEAWLGLNLLGFALMAVREQLAMASSPSMYRSSASQTPSNSNA